MKNRGSAQASALEAALVSPRALETGGHSNERAGAFSNRIFGRAREFWSF